MRAASQSFAEQVFNYSCVMRAEHDTRDKVLANRASLGHTEHKHSGPRRPAGEEIR